MEELGDTGKNPKVLLFRNLQELLLLRPPQSLTQAILQFLAQHGRDQLVTAFSNLDLDPRGRDVEAEALERRGQASTCEGLVSTRVPSISKIIPRKGMTQVSTTERVGNTANSVGPGWDREIELRAVDPEEALVPAVPAAEKVRKMREEAHGECFIANSVTSRLTTIPTFEVSGA